MVNATPASHLTRSGKLGPEKSRRRAWLLASTALVAAGLTITPLSAAAQTWNGSSSPNWVDAINWSTNTAPVVSGDVVISGAGGPTQPVLLGTDPAQTVNTVAISAGQLRLQNGARLTATNGVTVTGGTLQVLDTSTVTGPIAVSGGTLQKEGTLAGTLTLSGTGTLRSTATGSIGVLAFRGDSTITAATGTTLTQNDSFTFTGYGTRTVGSATEMGTVIINANGGSVNSAPQLVIAGGRLSFIGINADAIMSNINSTTVEAPGVLQIGTNTRVNMLGGAGTVTVSGATDRTLTLTGGASDFSGVLENGDATMSVVRSGTNRTTLSGANTYTGSTTVTAGTLAVTGAGTLASTDINVANGATFTTDGGALAAATTINTAATYTADGTENIAALTQTAGVVNGTGTVNLSGAFTQSGGTTGGAVTVNAGSFTQSGGAVIGAGSTVNSAGAKSLQGGTIAGTLGGTGATTVSSGTTTLSGLLAGGNVTLAAGGTLNLDGGDITANMLGAGGSLNAISDTTLSGIYTATGGANSTLSADAGTVLTMGTVNPGGNPSTLTFGAAGKTGTVAVSGANIIGTNASVAVANGTLRMATPMAGIILLNYGAGTDIAAAGTLDLYGNNTNINNLSGAGTITSSLTGETTLRLWSAVAHSFSGVVQDGAGTVGLIADSGALTLSGDNTFTGPTTVNGGLELAGDGSNLADVSTVLVNSGGTLALNGDETLGTLGGTGGLVDIRDDSVLTLGVAGTGTSVSNSTIASTGAGTGSLVKTGTNSQTLNGEVTLDEITVSDGTLTLTNAGNTISDINLAGTLSIQATGAAGGATITTSGSVIDYGSGVDLASLVVLNSDTTQLQVQTGSATQSGVISEIGTRPVEKIGDGELILAAANTYTGATNVTAGTLSVGPGGSLASAAVNVASGAAFNTAGGTLTDPGANITTGGTVTVSGGAEDVASVTQTGGMIEGAGLLRTGIFSQSGGEMAGTVTANGLQTLGGGILSGSLNGTGAIAATGGATTVSGTISNAASFTMSGPATAFTLTGAGSLDTSANTIAINGGTLTSTGNTIADDENVSVGAAAVLTLTGDETISSLAGAGTTVLDGGNLTTGNATDTTVSGAINGSGALTVQGSGRFTLGGINGYTGPTTLVSGMLDLDSGSAIADDGVVVVNGGTLQVSAAETVGSLAGVAASTVNADAALTTGGLNADTAYAGTVSGAGRLIKTGTGVMTLSGDNSVSNLTVQDGTLVLSGNNDPVASVTVGGGVGDATLRLESDLAAGGADGQIKTLGSVVSYADGIDMATSILLNSDTTQLDVAVGLATQSGVISEIGGVRPLEKIGAGKLVLTAMNSYSGAMTVSAGTLTNQGILAGAVTNNATFDNAGTVAGVVTNAGTSSNTGTIGGLVNSGDFGNSGTVAGDVTVTAGTVDHTGSVGGNVEISGGTMNATDGTVTGTTTNNGGTLNIDGGSFTGLVSNEAGSLTAGGSVTGSITNAATMTVSAPIGLTLAGALTNRAGGTLTSAGPLSTSMGLTNMGTVNAQGALNGNVTNTGTFNARMVAITGSVTNTGGTFDLTGGTLTGPALNSATFLLDGGTVSGTFTNSGTLSVLAATSLGGLDNTGGTVNMVGGGTGDVLTITGGILTGGIFQLSSDLTAGTADRIDATAATTSGHLDFRFSNVGGTYTGPGITVLDAANSDYTFSYSGLPIGGSIIYSLVQTGDDLQLVNQTSAGIGGISANVSSVQSLIGTVVNRPTSPFVAGLASERRCSQGGYARATIGKASVTGSSNNGVSTQSITLDASYQGMQGGYDFGCNDGRFVDGWDGYFGVMLGYNTGKTDQGVFNPLGTDSSILSSVTHTDFDQKYAGLYAVFSKDHLTADVQLRVEKTDFELNETVLAGSTGLGLANSRFDTNSVNLTSRVSYRMDLSTEGVTFVPTAGLSYTRTSDATLNLTGGETLEMDAFESILGFVGSTLAKTTVSSDSKSSTTLFASSTYYHDFAGNQYSTFMDGINPNQKITSQGINGFGEVSLGINHVRVLDNGPGGAKQLNANIRADATLGKDVKNGAGLTAQLRLSF